MHLIGLVRSVDHVCCRLRLAAYRSHLEAAGHSLELVELPTGWLARIKLLHGLGGASVVLQRKLLSHSQWTLLRRRARKLVFDFDDAVFLRDSFAAPGPFHSGRIRRFAEVMRDCDAVIAGNQYLAQQAAFWTSPERVHEIPTCVDPARYSLATHARRRDGVQLVWIGSSSTLRGLQRVSPMLESVGRHVPGLQLSLICDRFFMLHSLSVVPKTWSVASETGDLSAGDIGISWVPEDEWSQGKCGLKILQYMAAGLPVVTNPVGVHQEMVVHGETGFLVRSTDQWIDAVRRLARDPDLRRRMGAAGRRRLEDRYSVAIGAERWGRVLSSLEHQRTEDQAFSEDVA